MSAHEVACYELPKFSDELATLLAALHAPAEASAITAAARFAVVNSLGGVWAPREASELVALLATLTAAALKAGEPLIVNFLWSREIEEQVSAYADALAGRMRLARAGKRLQ